MNIYCLVTGRHRWSATMADVPAASAFYAIHCLRRGCGFSVDGVQLRSATRLLTERELRRVGKWLP